MIQAIDFLECRLRWKHGLQQEGPLIQLRHEVTADAKSEGDGRHGDKKCHQCHEPWVPKTAVDQRAIPLLDLTEQEHVFISSRARGTQDDSRSDRDERQRQHEGRDHRRDDGRRERLIHSPLDTRHAKERQEHDDDDEGPKAMGRATSMAADTARSRRSRRVGSWLEVYLQFDSLDERVLREIRGEDLREVRLRALEHLESYGVATTLVSVVKNGLNQGEVGAVVDLALTYRCIRGLRSRLRAVGRTDGFDPSLHRLTLTDVRAALIETGRFDTSSLRPHPCSPETVCIGYLSRSSGGAVTADLFEATKDPALSDLADSMFFFPRHTTRAFCYDDLFRVCIVSYMDRFDFSVESAVGSRMHFVGIDGTSTPLESRYLLPGGLNPPDRPQPLRVVARRD